MVSFPPIECDVGIVGGGASGLYMAYKLLFLKKEKNVCVFERETKIGGRIFDYRFKEAPNILVGKLPEKVSEILIINVIDYSLQK